MLKRFLHKAAAHMRRSQHEPIITVLIHCDAYLANVKLLQSLAPNWRIAPVIKSNAYGHGLTITADIIENEKSVPFFCVDSYAEASIVRNIGIKKPMLVLGHTPVNVIARGRLHNVASVVTSLKDLRELAKIPARIHLKFDTGMHRQGIPPAAFDEVAQIIRDGKCVVEGVLSHLADAETADSKITEEQISVWNNLATKFQKDFPTIRYYHLANSAGFAHYEKINANLARPGIATYGLNPGNLNIALKPVLEMRAVVSEIRNLEPGESVGYNATFTADKPMRVATVPCGYFEGVDRRLSNKGFFKIKEKFAPIIGRVSMNITSCDITNFPDVKIGTPVTIISNNPTDPNSAENIAKLIGTISYDVVASIPASLRRQVV